ncbi:UNVERIFIED_CONTAM: hypothetical protein K2H54_050032 [Gekko kuhli]
MSLLGNYRKKTNNDGYESLQLVDSNGDFCGSREGSGGGGGGSSISISISKQGVIPAVVAAAAAARSPVRQQHQPLDCSSTMDSSARAARPRRGLGLRLTGLDMSQAILQFRRRRNLRRPNTAILTSS